MAVILPATFLSLDVWICFGCYSILGMIIYSTKVLGSTYIRLQHAKRPPQEFDSHAAVAMSVTLPAGYIASFVLANVLRMIGVAGVWEGAAVGEAT